MDFRTMMTLEPHGPDTFVATGPSYPWGGLYGGQIVAQREGAFPRGTQITVEDLFYNVPARRKFLKSDAAEAAQVSRFVTQLALCYPTVGFTLVSSGRKVIAVPPVTGPVTALRPVTVGTGAA